MKTTHRIASLACTLCIGFFPQTAGAWLITGAYLSPLAQAEHRVSAGTATLADYTDAARFGGYVSGIVDAMWAEDDMKYKGCFGSVVTRGQFVTIARLYIASHPEQWSQPGFVLVRNAVNEACNKNLSARR